MLRAKIRRRKKTSNTILVIIEKNRKMEKILYVCKYRKSRINILKVIVCKLYKSCKAIKKINKFKVERSGCLYIKIERKENQHCKLLENGTTVLPAV